MNTAIVTHTHAREATSRQPARNSCRIGAAGPCTPRERGRTLSNSSALITNVAASNTNASPAPTPSTSAVDSAGPIMIARFAADSVSAIASWIIDSGTVCGISPVYAGWKNARAAPNSASITISCQIRTAPVKISAARMKCSAARLTSATIMIRWRGRRSAHTPPNSISETIGSACAASTSPRSVGEPVWRVMNSASATITTWSPTALAA